MNHRALKPMLLTLSCLVMPFALAGVAWGEVIRDRARVVNVEPVYEKVRYSVPVETCTTEYVSHHGRSHTAPIVGAIIGGAVGHAVGHHKRNKQIGTVVGALLGGTIGADVARRHGSHRPGIHERQVCDVVDEYHTEDRLTGYDVTYRYAGWTYTARMDHKPGKYVPVHIRVTPLV